MNLQSQRLSPDKEATLRDWLKQPGFSVLQEVLRSDAFKARVGAAKFRTDPESRGAIEGAPALDKAASLIDGALHAIEAVKNQPDTEPFNVYTAIP